MRKPKAGWKPIGASSPEIGQPDAPSPPIGQVSLYEPRQPGIIRSARSSVTSDLASVSPYESQSSLEAGHPDAPFPPIGQVSLYESQDSLERSVRCLRPPPSCANVAMRKPKAGWKPLSPMLPRLESGKCRYTKTNSGLETDQRNAPLPPIWHMALYKTKSSLKSGPPDAPSPPIWRVCRHTKIKAARKSVNPMLRPLRAGKCLRDYAKATSSLETVSPMLGRFCAGKCRRRKLKAA